MSLAVLANTMASKGRNGDSMLVHMSPDEVRALQALAERHGKTLTINPETGQPEAFSLKSLLPAIAGFALGPAGFGLMSAGMAGATVGGLTALATGDISRGLMAGLGAYGGAGLGEALSTAGTGALASQITGDVATANAADIASGQLGEQAVDKMVTERLADTSGIDKLTAGARAITESPSTALDFAKANYKPLAAAAAPIMAGAMVPTTTGMPRPVDTGYIRQKKFNPYTQQYIDLEPVKASEWGSRRFSDYADGGIVALADGGVSANQYFAANKDVADAYKANSYGMTPDEFATYHYQNYGQNEQRNAPAGLAALAQPAQPSLTPQQEALTQAAPAAAPARAGIDAFQIGSGQNAAAAQYLQNNPDVAAWLTSKEGKAWEAQNPGYDPADIAWTHYVRYGANEGRQWGVPTTTPATTPNTPATTTTTTLPTNPQTNAPPGTTNPYGNKNNPGDLTFNPDGTVTVTPNIPGRPYGGFSGMNEVKNAYTAGGGSLGPTNLFVPQTVQDMYNRYTTSGGSQQAYDYLMNKGSASVQKPVTRTGELMLPYAQSVLGQEIPAITSGSSTQKYIFDPKSKRYVLNPAYADPIKNSVSADVAAAAANWGNHSATSMANGGVMRMALGGLGALAAGGQAGYNLGSYSDGGRLLRGPGDGVSDSIPATIGDKQPARLADGEFVVPARIVSELGNGSTDAGARKLYAMMDRVQRARGKTTGKGKVAKDTSADKYLPA